MHAMTTSPRKFVLGISGASGAYERVDREQLGASSIRCGFCDLGKPFGKLDRLLESAARKGARDCTSKPSRCFFAITERFVSGCKKRRVLGGLFAARNCFEQASMYSAKPGLLLQVFECGMTNDLLAKLVFLTFAAYDEQS